MVGIFTLSLDTEIAWGTDPNKRAHHRDAFNNYRATVDRLLKLLDEFAMPATWAVVGHLLLEPGDARALVPDDAPLAWYFGTDIVQSILDAVQPHEIGTHTFSHVIADEVNAKVWVEELATCVQLHRKLGLPLRSLVYPRNRIAHLRTLDTFGITAYRGMEANWYQGVTGQLGRASHFVDRALAITPPTYALDTLRGGNVVNVPASQFLMTYDGVRRRIPSAARLSQARKGLDRAVQRGHLYHLWLHPFNLEAKLFRDLRRILRDAAQRRDAGELQVLTMAQVADEVLLRQPLVS